MTGVLPKSLPFAGIGVALIAAVHAATNATDTQALLNELQAIEDKQKAAQQQQLGRLARKLMDASRSEAAAARLYIEATKNLAFDSRSGDAARFRDWRRNQKDMLENKVFQTALLFHVRYLAITLAVASNQKQPLPIGELISYVKDLVKEYAQYGGHEGLGGNEKQMVSDLLDKPLADGVIAQTYFLQPVLKKMAGNENKDWQPNAGDWRKILDTDVRSGLREARDPALLETWQLEINLGQAELAANRSDVARANFSQVEMPHLLWRQAQDMLALGQNANAVAAMTKLVRTYPQHPDVLAWIDELRSLLKQAGQNAPAATPEASPHDAGSF